MTGFEPGSSGIGSDCSANCAITTAQKKHLFFIAVTIRKVQLYLYRPSTFSIFLSLFIQLSFISSPYL